MSVSRLSRLVVRGGLCAVIAATAACSLTMGFDGFAGDGNSGDAGPDSPVTVDSANSNPGTDSGPGTDAGDSGNPEVDAGDPNTPPVFVDGGSFCDTQDGTVFCEDFDTTDLPVHWEEEGAWARLTSYQPRSAPNVFLVDPPATSESGTFVSKITKTMSAQSTNMIVAFDFNPEQVDLGTSFLILAALEYSTGTAKYSMRLVYTSGSVRLEESDLVTPPNNKDEYHPFFQIPMNTWTRVKLDIVASGTTPGCTVSLDGTTVGVRETLTPTAGIDTTPTLILGAVYAASPHSGWTLRYDNVTVTYR